MIDYRERVVSLLLKQGYWTITSYPVALTEEDGSELGIELSPENTKIDILAYRPVNNQLIWVVYKYHRFPAFSGVVRANQELLLDSGGLEAVYLRIFTDARYRERATTRLVERITELGLTLPAPQITYCLIAGIDHASQAAIEELFSHNGWLIFDEETLNRTENLALSL